MSFNLATILAETALATPDAPVNIFSDVTTTYRELDEQSSLLAAGLSETGLSPGQVVALQLPNLPQFLTAYFGILKAGMVVLPLNPQLMAPEVEYQLADSGAAIMIGLSGMHAEADRACQRLGVPLYLVRTSAPLPPGTQRATDLIGIAPRKIEFLDKLSPQFLEDETGNYQLMV